MPDECVDADRLVPRCSTSPCRTGQAREVTMTSRLLPQLAAAGFMPRSVTFLALSHYHWDHTANANAFAAATWLVRPVERDAMFAAMPPALTQPATYSALREAASGPDLQPTNTTSSATAPS